MERLIISCGMLCDEIKLVCRGKKQVPKIMMLRRALHETPGELRKTLQRLIEEHQNVDEIILTFGLCGNGVVGLKSENTRLILPKFDDCISQLLYLPAEGRKERSKVKKGHMYLTRQWTKDREAVLSQCRDITNSYKEEAPEILSEIYGAYTTVTLVDTGAYTMEKVWERAEQIRDYLPVEIEQEQGSTAILEKIISGAYDENFIILNPGEMVEEKMFRFNGR